LRVLTVGTPEERADPDLPEGWIRVKCHFCEGEMRCQEKNANYPPGVELVLVCLTCLENDKLTPDDLP